MPTANRSRSRDKVRAHRTRMRKTSACAWSNLGARTSRSREGVLARKQGAISMLSPSPTVPAERGDQVFVDSISVWPGEE